MSAGSDSLRTTGALAPLTGILIGALGGAVYCVTSLLWPSSVAVILVIAATTLTSQGRALAAGPPTALLIGVLGLLIKFNALMALSAAKLPFAVPATFPLALIMICGYAASYALSVSMMSARGKSAEHKVGAAGLSVALLIGFAPALLLGIPGLVGLAAAVLVSLGLIAFFKFNSGAGAAATPEAAQLTTELSFYLGALASWRFV